MLPFADRLIYDRITITTADPGTNYLRTLPVKPATVQHIKIVSVEDKTGQYSRLRIGAYENGVFMPYFEQINPDSSELYFSTNEILLREGMQLQAQLERVSAGDHLEMYIQGHWEEVEKSAESETPKKA